MSSILYIFLTLLMFVDCVILVFLVLLQLPKKDAGAGLAFGGGATDALFGAGSGNVLTKITKYAAGLFFGLAIIMAWMATGQHGKSGGQSLQEELMKGGAPISSPGIAPSSAPSTAPPVSSGLLQLSNLPPVQSNAPSAPPAANTTAPSAEKPAAPATNVPAH